MSSPSSTCGTTTPVASCGGLLVALVLLTGGCVDKAPPPMWPAPPPPRVAKPMRADEFAVVPVTPVPVAGAVPVPLDAVPAASILDPESSAATTVPKGAPPPRPVPSHK